MDIISLKLVGYKRIEASTLNTSGKVVAIVGPNEAGKSSILKALEHLNHENSFSTSELTRGNQPQENDVIIEACFLLDDIDREALSGLYEGINVRQFRIRKLFDGHKEFEVRPSLKRDPSYRYQLSTDLTVTLGKVSVGKAEFSDSDINPEKTEALTNSLEEVILELNNFDKDIEKHNFQELTKLSSILNSKNEEEESEEITNLCILIDSFIARQQEIDPNKKAEEILISRIPKILFFDEGQRRLESAYELSQHADSPPPALRNLANLSGLNLSDLYDAIRYSEQARVNSLLNKANDQITRIVQDKWSQSGVKIALSSDASVLHIFIENEERDCTNLDDRSDGLRQFVALINFLEAEHADQKPILLIDEAETHLHYDAQADLMNMFSKQQLASKIIYTTHSAGCLPEDLGNGVRCISPIRDKEKSEINNWFWKDNRPGFSPLLFGMGASSLAFFPLRKAIFVEGATDMLLLPTMFRQVTNRSFLGFQIAPGLSVAANSDLSLLENEASKVAFLTDNNGSGKILTKQLKEAGVEESRIFNLPGEDGTVLEDCISKELYLEAINNELLNWNQNPPIMSLKDLPDINRPNAVKIWCKAQGIEPPEKRVIAYRLLDFANGENQKVLVRANLKEAFEELYKNLTNKLDL
jgi:predicted ATP-dependent endonuclease of OLD family